MVDGTFSVAALLDGVRDAVSARFPEPVWVHGEIASIKRGRNGHVWFDLVDRADDGTVTATVPVVLWSSVRVGVNAQLKRAGSIRMDDGVRIRILGSLDLWVPGGRLQVQMQGIDPTYTLGLLASERDRVLKALEADGIVHRNRLLQRPAVPRRVALVTAAGSAAEADFLQILANSSLAWEVVVVDARVQGAGSERSVAAALLTAADAAVDLVALVRGGGARTDLATFDHELVARTIAMLDVPVLTGIGHEIDTSVADLVAHAAHTTPTACAAAIVDMALDAAGRAELAWQGIVRASRRQLADEGRVVTHHAAHVARGVRGRLLVEGHRADAATARLGRSAPAALLRAHSRIERRAARADASTRAHFRVHALSLELLAARLGPVAATAVRRAGAELTATESQLAALDPARALERGWSITRTATGSVVRDPA
ncbi:MAG TPA: exodeoxyribonuclease VII large subunit, partial [Acidimicrobiales bacterium]